MEKIVNYYNTHDPANNYTTILYRAGYGSQSREQNEVQSIISARITRLANALFKDGDVIAGAQIGVDAESGKVQATAGQIFMDGRIWNLEASDFVIPVTGTVAVGMRLHEKVVSEMEDPGLRNPAIGNRAEGLPGAWRLQEWATWGWDGDGGEGQLYPVYTIDDGVQRAKDAPPALDSFNQVLARYDRDSTGTGTYVVSGLLVRAGDNLEDGRQVYHLAEGRARVGGIGVDLPTSRRVIYPATPDLRTIGMEIVDATADAKTETGQRIDVAHAPLGAVHSLRITVEETFDMVHGAYQGCADDLPVTGVISIEEVKQLDTVFEAATDYVKRGDQIDWAASGAEPANGSTYQARVRYLKDVEPISKDLDGFCIRDAVPGTQVLFSYDQMLPRYDRMAMDSEGMITWFKGIASERNPIRPTVPDSLLLLATIYQNWRENRQLSNDAPRVMAFEDISAIQDRLAYVETEVARNRLEMDAATRESGARRGIFADPTVDDTMRDQGLAQTGAIVDEGLTLPVTNVSVSLLSGDVEHAVSRPWTVKPLIEQLLRTGEMQVNPYMAFDPLPAIVALNPAVDRWTETRTSWTSSTTREFWTYASSYHYAKGSGQGPSRITGTSTITEVVSSSSTNLQYLRQIDVSFNVSGFGPGEKLSRILFDNVDVTASAGALSADGSGKFTGKFRIPPSIPVGSKLVEIYGAGGSFGTAVFVGSGTLTVQTLRQVTQTNREFYDPLAQTFALDAPAMIGGIDLWFTKKKTEVRIQIRNVENGMPGKTILAETSLMPERINVNGQHTRALFDCPVLLEGNADYAFVVLCDDPETTLSLAEAGKFDSSLQKWVSSQPYAIGVLLSSSNAATWTPHQTMDLTFRILAADFGGTDDYVIDLGAAAIENATEILLRSLSEIPSAACRCEYELALPNGSTITAADGQAISLGQKLSGSVGVKARLSGDASFSALLYPGTELISGTLAESGDYYARTIPASGALKATLIFDAYIPSGASVNAKIQLDRGEWQEMAKGGEVKGDDGFVEFTYTRELSNVNEIKAMFDLHGTPAAVPYVRDIRLLATA